MGSAIWWKKGVIYHIYPRSFNDTSGNGLGDLQGIIDKLDYLNDGTENSLGIDAIWLSPVYPSPQEDFGYDVADYTDINPDYGTLEKFRNLLAEAHGRNIKVILDLVLNHTSHTHQWFIESRSSVDNPKRDWYIWRDGSKGKPPNNWGSYFGGSAWNFDSETGQCYLAMFDPSQPDLNWRNPEVKEALFNVVRFWLDMGVDGFRLDVYNQYYKDEQLRSNPLRLNPVGLFYKFHGQRHVYDRDQPEMYPALKELRKLVDSYPERMMVGETADEGDFMSALGYYGKQNDGLHLAFNFDFLHSRWRAADFRRAIIKWEKYLPEWGWPTYVLSNHDVPRHFSRYCGGAEGEARARVAAAMLLTLRGTPTLYYGEEIGQSDIKLTKSMVMDPPGKRFWPFYKGRDGCRAPMQWNSEEYGGFSKVKSWLPVNSDFRRRNVEIQQADKDSLQSFYRKLIWLRKFTPALHSGTLELIDNGNSEIIAYRRNYAGETVLVMLNFSGKSNNLSIDGMYTVRVLIGTQRDGIISLGENELTLQGNEVLVLKVEKEGVEN